MTLVHRTMAGQWVECDDSGCKLPYHVPDMSVAELEAMPERLLWPLLEALDPPSVLDEYGYRSWLDAYDGAHREYDLPAEISKDGTAAWYRKGRLHREGDKPAIIYPWGELEWWQDGQKHREGAPAVICTAPDFPHEEWWRHGNLHRENAPAVVYRDREEWWLNGQRHREGGPAWSNDKGEQHWYLYGKRVEPPAGLSADR